MSGAEQIDTSLLGEAKLSLERIQSFNAESLVRRDVLGMYAFDDAIDPARRLIDLFATLPVSHLVYFPDQQIRETRDVANNVYSVFQTFLDFDVESAQPSVTHARDTLVQYLSDIFQHTFNVLSPLIAFSTVRAQDFSAMERDARAAVQAAKDQVATLVQGLDGDKKTIEGILKEARDAAAEQGVSKQAIHFKTEADKHETQAGIWLIRSALTALGLGAFAIISLFLHNVPGLDSTSGYRMAQIAVSKVLIFGVIAYMLILCAKNFLSHRHNEVVNRHRQNALATFTALVEATSDAASSDIVLSHAASCIFSPQETWICKARRWSHRPNPVVTASSSNTAGCGKHWMMATRSDLKKWVFEALQILGPTSVPNIAKHIWDNHQNELKASGDLFYTWQYAMRWEGQKLQLEGKLRKNGKGRIWELT